MTKFIFPRKIKKKHYSTRYFLTSQKVLNDNNPNVVSLLRFKHFNHKVLVCGIEECLQLIKFALNKKQYLQTKIYYLPDGTLTTSKQPILVLEGYYRHYAFLENIINGILTRRSMIATNAYKLLKIIPQADRIIYMNDRSDDYHLQPYDGYSAYVGGIRQFVTKMQTHFLRHKQDFQIIGTIPHALIQQYKGNLVYAIKAYQKSFPKQKTTALIDFTNNCLKEIHLLQKGGISKLDYVRIDTSKKLIDQCLKKQKQKHYGINPKLVAAVRKCLDANGFFQTKIIVSSGLTPQKIQKLEKAKIKPDIYGIGQYFLQNNSLNFTGDLIK